MIFLGQRAQRIVTSLSDLKNMHNVIASFFFVSKPEQAQGQEVLLANREFVLRATMFDIRGIDLSTKEF